MFEAGAVATQVKKKAYLCPYLIDLETSDVDYPLAQFQMKKWDREGTLALVRGINDALAETEPKSAIPAANLDTLFEVLWPQLEKQYASAPEEVSKSAKIEQKNPAELMGETLEQTRDLARQLERMEQKLEGISINTLPRGWNPLLIPGGIGSSVATGLGLSTVHAFGEGWKNNLDVDSALVNVLTQNVREQLAKTIKSPPEPRCPKCGATENNFRVAEAKIVNPRIKHHDVTCGVCDAVIRQFHLLDTDEQKREWACKAICKFHLNPESVATDDPRLKEK